MTTYKFKEQLAKGQAQERVLDTFFRSHGWKIAETNMTDQRRGIDRWFEMSMLADTYAIEYKADMLGHNTGNVYLETVSVGHFVDGKMAVTKQGWLWTTQADFLMYYMPGSGRLMTFKPDDLRAFAIRHDGEYRSVAVKNSGYYGQGLLAPVVDLTDIILREWQVDVDNVLAL